VNQFVKVFDVLESGYRDWTFPASGLIFVVIGIALVAFPKFLKNLNIPNATYLNGRPRLQAFFRYAVLGFALLWTVTTFLATYSQHSRHKALARENNCRVVEGPVEHFVPMPYTGHALESFSVAGVVFKYSDYVVTDGFNNTSSHGGPIKSDSFVRICYDPADHAILRLEIRDFNGELKDYSKGENIFSFPSSDEIQKLTPKNSPENIPWYSNLLIILYFLDFAGIQFLFLPYLRTFFRLKTMALPDCPISRALSERTKTKLRNSLIYWDSDNQTIWLRPRGFNRIKMPLMVAALNVHAGGKTIVANEIRFSSGFPLVMILFFWTAFRLFSATMPPELNSWLPAPFVGIGALMFIVAGFFRLRADKSRMQRLVEEALLELRGR
jgi:hypothetical protein